MAVSRLVFRGSFWRARMRAPPVSRATCRSLVTTKLSLSQSEPVVPTTCKHHGRIPREAWPILPGADTHVQGHGDRGCVKDNLRNGRRPVCTIHE